MKYATEMNSAAIMHIQSLMRTGSATQKLIGGIHIDTQRAW
jgi:hypothetical protein